MSEIFIVCGSALWFGVLTSISPCSLATNIAAVSFLSKKIDHPRAVLFSGIIYTMGRMTAYAVLGIAVITSLVGIPFIANFLQQYMNKLLGPILLFCGLFLVDIIRLNFSGISLSMQKQKVLAGSGLRGAFALGMLFAMAFCPISAALFFGSLIPLSLSSSYGVLLPLLYGIGTGLPVLMFSFAIAFGITTLSHWFKRMSVLEKYTRKITGIIFILVGAYLVWAYLAGSA